MLALALVMLVSPGPLEVPVAESLATDALADDPPKIVRIEPEHLDLEVDAKETKSLVVVFDRPMNDAGYSVCGGGPNFPKFKSKPRWDSREKFVVDVELEPDHDYQLGLNCSGASNFQSEKGVPLVPTPWMFRTLPEKLPNQAQQKAANHKAFDALKKELASSYSYYDLRVKDWEKLFRAHEPKILASKTTRGWTGRVARMLAATEDLHLYLRCENQVYPTGTRAVDSLYRRERLAQYVSTEVVGSNGLAGRTQDGIAYVMIGAWERAGDVDALEVALRSLSDAKAFVVDVRPNSGGDELLARRIAAWFVEGTKVYAKNRYRTGPGKNGFGPVFDRSVQANDDASKRLTVPVAVLTSRYVMSSNESFVLMLRQARDCTVVGERTYGSSGNPKPHELSNGVTVFVPSWQDLRPDGTCFEGEGLAPDVEVAATAEELASRDPILERALEILRAKTK